MDVMPSIDSIAEFRVLTSNYSAEYGLSSAATMTMAIKSGTKAFHAGAWEFLRNDALDARNTMSVCVRLEHGERTRPRRVPAHDSKIVLQCSRIDRRYNRAHNDW